MKDPQRQKRILEICDSVLSAPAAEQPGKLAQACAGDVELFDDVNAMLQRIADADDTTQHEDTSRDPLHLLGKGDHTTNVGDVLGDFLLEELIGSGGMGAVFRASRSDKSSKQQVAIKVLHAQIMTPELRLRFNTERDILARLRHPYIAGLVDGGTTPQGVPYLAMELIEGISIDRFCDSQRMTVDGRIALLEKVASALQHAHQNLIIHRDIKPSNVLVTHDGIPKLVDFGIAKMLEPAQQGVDSEDSSASTPGATTVFGQQALTPDFASPEQLLNGQASTASDIYSLGVLSVVLLTGHKPYAIDTSTPSTIQNSFNAVSAIRASTLLQNEADTQTRESLASLRSVTADRLRRTLRGDLDTILGKATHRDIQRRYLNASEFAADLQRFRRNEPVSARGDSIGYRTWSLIRANRLAFSVLGATVLALSFGLAAALWQARIANDRFTDLHAFARVVMGEIYDSVAELPGSTPARTLIATEGQRYLDKLAQQDLQDDALLADLSLAYRRIADVQGRPANANLGMTDAALQNYLKAEAIAESIDTESDEMMRARAQVYRRKAGLLAWQGKVEVAINELKRSRAMFETLLERSPDDPNAQIDLAYNLIDLGDVSGHPYFQNIGDSSTAAKYYTQTISLLRESAAQSSNRELLRAYSVAQERSGTIALKQKQLDNAQRYFEASRDIRLTLAQQHPDHTNIQRDAGVAIEQIAKVQLQTGALNDALENFRSALDVYLKLLNIDPSNANAKRTVAIGHTNLGDAYRQANKFDEARTQLAFAVRLWEELVAADPGTTQLVSRLNNAKSKLHQLNAEQTSP